MSFASGMRQSLLNAELVPIPRFLGFFLGHNLSIYTLDFHRDSKANTAGKAIGVGFF